MELDGGNDGALRYPDSFLLRLEPAECSFFARSAATTVNVNLDGHVERAAARCFNATAIVLRLSGYPGPLGG